MIRSQIEKSPLKISAEIDQKGHAESLWYIDAQPRWLEVIHKNTRTQLSAEGEFTRSELMYLVAEMVL